MKNFFSKNIKEIQDHKNLVWFGVVLSLTHLLTGYFWWTRVHFDSSMICWGFFSQCQRVYGVFFGLEKLILGFYSGLAVVCAALFGFKKVKPAYFVLVSLSVFKIIVHISDYRLMGNYHYMANILYFSFLLLPYKEATIKVFVLMFYFTAGLIKFNSEWLSGLAMARQPAVSGKLLEVGCVLVIFLELIGTFYLISKKRLYFWLIFVSYIAFHIFSWHVVGYFYPLIMFSMLTFFVISPLGLEIKSKYYIGGIIGVFMSVQVGVLVLFSNSALSGEGRILSLNMLDAYSVCQNSLFIKSKGETIEYNPVNDLEIRIHCDPLVLIRQAELTCRNFQGKNDFIDIDMSIQVASRSRSEQIEQKTFQNVCAHPLKISFLGKISQNE